MIEEIQTPAQAQSNPVEEETLHKNTNPEEQTKAMVEESKNSSRNWLPVILVVFLILIIGGGVAVGLTVFKDQIPFISAKPTPTPTQVVIPTPTPTPNPDITADWQNYQNTKYSYLIKYPSSWKEDKNMENPDNLTIFTAPDGTGLEILATKTSEKNLKTYLAAQDKVSKTAWEGQPSIRVISSREITINKYQAVERKEELLAAGFSTTKTYILTNGYVYSFMILPGQAQDLSESEIGNKYSIILLTFSSLLDIGLEKQINCSDPRPEVCTLECLVNPPYICGSDGKSYCTTCQACQNKNVEWYVMQESKCS